MQQRPENDLVYTLTVLEAAGKIKIYCSAFSNASDFFFANDQLNFNASLLLLATIGDHVAKISEDNKNKYSHIPWKKIKSLRNRVVHDYVGVDYDIVFEILTNEIPDLTNAIENLVKNEIACGNFSLEEVNIAAASQWYRHVHFGLLLDNF